MKHSFDQNTWTKLKTYIANQERKIGEQIRHGPSFLPNSKCFLCLKFCFSNVIVDMTGDKADLAARKM